MNWYNLAVHLWLHRKVLETEIVGIMLFSVTYIVFNFQGCLNMGLLDNWLYFALNKCMLWKCYWLTIETSKKKEENINRSNSLHGKKLVIFYWCVGDIGLEKMIDQYGIEVGQNIEGLILENKGKVARSCSGAVVDSQILDLRYKTSREYKAVNRFSLLKM